MACWCSVNASTFGNDRQRVVPSSVITMSTMPPREAVHVTRMHSDARSNRERLSEGRNHGT